MIAVGIALALTLGSAGAAPRELLAEFEAFDTQLASLDAQLATLESTLVAAEASRVRLEAEAAAAEAKLKARTEGASALLQGLYRLRRFGVLRSLFGAEDSLELRRRSAYLHAVLGAEKARATDFAALAAQRREAAAGAVAANAATASLRDLLLVQRASLATERARRKTLVREVRSEPALVGRAATETAEARKQFQGAVVSAEPTVKEPVAPPTSSDFRAARGRLPWPVRGRLVLGFGPRVDEVSGFRTSNNGLDWLVEPGDTFHAVFPGVVTRAGYVRGYGQMVMLQHGSFTTLYAHANGIRVVVDQAVKAGDVLGTAGTTGLAAEGAPQLHFEVRYNGTPQDPTEWLAK